MPFLLSTFWIPCRRLLLWLKKNALFYNMLALLSTQATLAFSRSDLSAFYFDVAKDRLYNEPVRGADCRAARTVLWHCLQALTQVSIHINAFVYWLCWVWSMCLLLQLMPRRYFSSLLSHLIMFNLSRHVVHPPFAPKRNRADHGLILAITDLLFNAANLLCLQENQRRQ